MLEQRSAVRRFVDAVHTRGTIGSSESGRPLEVQYRCGQTEDTAVRLAVVAGQRGDDPLTRSAVVELAEATAGGACQIDGTQLALLVDVNPDGAASGRSTNHHGVDLTRDHLRLRALETRNWHRFMRDWSPHLVVLLETFEPQTVEVDHRRFVQRHDLVVDFASNLAVNHPLRGAEHLELVDPLCGALAEQGLLVGRAIQLAADGSATHGNCELTDARNGLALRYRVPVLSLAARVPLAEAPSGVDRSIAGLAAALRWLVDWADRKSFLLTAPQPAGYDSVPLGCCPVEDPSGLSLAVRDTQDGAIREITLPHRYTPVVEETHRVRLPHAYAIHAQQNELLHLLSHHGFVSRRADYRRTLLTERYWIAERADGSVTFHSHTEARLLEDHLVFPVAQAGGHALALLLEPESQFGLTAYPELGLAQQPASYYPVVRLAG